jgi:hypothetical protein
MSRDFAFVQYLFIILSETLLQKPMRVTQEAWSSILAGHAGESNVTPKASRSHAEQSHEEA